MFRKILLYLAILIFVVTLAACKSETDSINNTNNQNEAKVATNKNGVSIKIVSAVEQALKNQAKLTEDGDYEKFAETYLGNLDADFEDLMKRIMNTEPTIEFQEIDVLHHMEDEVLVYTVSTLTSSKDDPDYNYNQTKKSYIVLKEVDSEWKVVPSYDENAAITFLDDDGISYGSSSDFDDTELWSKELESLKGKTPSEWMIEVQNKKKN